MKKIFTSIALFSSVVFASAQIGFAPDGVPSNVAASIAPGTNGFTPTISWTDTSSNEDSFVIERGQGVSNVQFVTIAAVPANITNYSDTAVASIPVTDSLGIFTYRVSAINSYGITVGAPVVIQKNSVQGTTVSSSQTLRELFSGVSINTLANYLNIKVGEANTLLRNQGEYIASILVNPSKATANIGSDQCVTISQNLYRGNESTATKNLQAFLVEKGFLSVEPTGFFGDLTVAAVKAYQRSMGIKETGMVYDYTRQAILDDSCK